MDHFRSKVRSLLATLLAGASLVVIVSGCTQDAASSAKSADDAQRGKPFGSTCKSNDECSALDQCINGVCSQPLNAAIECYVDYDCDCRHYCFSNRCAMLSGSSRC